MKQVVIENPVINSPFAEPQRHFRFSEEGITNEIADARRDSAYFIRIGHGRGPTDLLNLILECIGQKKKDKEAKDSTARALWEPAVNNHGEFGRWDLLEIRDPWDAEKEIGIRIKSPNQ